MDGARYLRDELKADATLCALVAHHSGAAVEAECRELSNELADFGAPGDHERLLGFVTAADLTTTPDGQLTSPVERIAEIKTRYPAESIVHQAICRSGDDLIATTHRVMGHGNPR